MFAHTYTGGGTATGTGNLDPSASPPPATTLPSASFAFANPGDQNFNNMNMTQPGATNSIKITLSNPSPTVTTNFTLESGLTTTISGVDGSDVPVNLTGNGTLNANNATITLTYTATNASGDHCTVTYSNLVKQ